MLSRQTVRPLQCTVFQQSVVTFHVEIVIFFKSVFRFTCSVTLRESANVSGGFGFLYHLKCVYFVSITCGPFLS